MKSCRYIKGIDELLKKLPENCQYWYKFSKIISLNYGKEFDYEKSFDYVDCIDMILTDWERKYKINIKLIDVVGEISFNIRNGFFSGLEIVYHESYDYRRYEFTSFEQDIYFEVWCRDISVKLIEE
ncbi:MAG: hypothetical protein K2F73_07175 [Ruminococcus sp.]|nr:hypothetical protein [Ruminococcus sp.]MDE6102740.1 hypothetical protein [Ruminococcus sp.]